MIWHGDPNAFPTVAQIHYGTGPIYPTSCPPQSVGWGPMPPPTPDSALISTQGFVPRQDASFPIVQYQPKPGAQDGVPSLPKRDVPRVMPMPRAGEIDLLKLGQWQGQAVQVSVPDPGATVTQTGTPQIIDPRPVVESTVHAIDLLTQPMTSQEPSYVLSGEGQKCNVSDRSIEAATIIDDEASSLDLFKDIVKDRSKSPNVSENNVATSTSKEATKPLEPSPLILSSSIASPDRKTKKAAKPRTSVRRFLATTNNGQPRKKLLKMDGTAKSAAPSCTSRAIRSPAISETIINPEDNVSAGSLAEVPRRSAMPEEDTDEVDYLQPLPSSPNWEAEMNSLFEFDGASLGWKNEAFWKKEDSAQTGQHGCPGHPMKVFRGTRKLPFCLDPWVDDELKMPLWGL